jgi:diguanylate cyclase (GGDEF)-like protein
MGVLPRPSLQQQAALERYSFAKSHLDYVEMGKAVLELGLIALDLGDLQRATNQIYEAKSLLLNYGGPTEHAWVDHGLAMLELVLGNYNDALEYFEASLHKAPREDSTLVGRSLQGLGLVHRYLDNYELSNQLLKQALEMHEEANNLASIAAARNSLGINCLHHGEDTLGIVPQNPDLVAAAHASFHKAAEHFTAVVQIAQQLKDIPLEVKGAQNLADVKFLLGDHEGGLKDLYDTLGLVHRGGQGLERSEGYVYLDLGFSYRDMEQFEKALGYFEKSVARFDAVGFPNDIRRALEPTTELLEKLGRFEEALQLFKRFHEITLKLRSESATRHAQVLTAKLETERAQQENDRLKLQATKWQERAYQDPLTQLLNRAALEQAVNQLEAADVALVMLDLDYFKQINDRFSHQIGDEVLKHVAHILTKQCRPADIATRYGGEEFALLLHRVTPQITYSVCERIRLAIQTHDWSSVQPSLQVTASLGFCLRENLDWKSWLEAADSELYNAKDHGRNQTSPVCSPANTLGPG